MKAWIPLTLALALGYAAHAEDCTYPRSPDAIPDGNTATKEQMIASKNDVSRYNTEMNAYLDCVSREIDAAKPKDTLETLEGREGESRRAGQDSDREARRRRR